MYHMRKANKKFYITTSIAYTNAAPHIGFALEIVQADVLARYHRILGEDAFFLTGTDEHGAKNARTAEESRRTPKEFTDEISSRYRELTKTLNISNDEFIRTTDKIRHWPSVKKVWLALDKNGDLYRKKYNGLYCVGCEAFITKKDMKNGKCIHHLKEPEVIQEENYFFRLSRYAPQIKKIIASGRVKIVPQSRAREMLAFISKGLEDVSFSRPGKDLAWGVPVPGDNTQTIYVWADALTNYISILDYARAGAKFKKYWPADVHCVGKDILRFHAIIWLGILLSLKLSLPKSIFVHGFITAGGQKMSKTLGNVIDPFELVKQYGVDSLRYYLLREIPSAEDGDFTKGKFEERYNADLAKGLGNLTARVVTLAAGIKIVRGNYSKEIKEAVDSAWRDYRRSLDDFKFNETLAAVWALIGFCDRYIERERPWENKGGREDVISDLLFALANIASMLRPFMPETADKIFGQLGVTPAEKKAWKFKPEKGASLFPRL